MLGVFVHADITQVSRRRENSLAGVWKQPAAANSVSAPPARPAETKRGHRGQPDLRVLTVLPALKASAAAND